MGISTSYLLGVESMTIGIDDSDTVSDKRSVPPTQHLRERPAEEVYEFLNKWGPYMHTKTGGSLIGQHYCMVGLLRSHLITFRREGLYQLTYDGGDGKIGVYCPECAMTFMEMRHEVLVYLGLTNKEAVGLEKSQWDKAEDVMLSPAFTLKQAVDLNTVGMKLGAEIIGIGPHHTIHNQEIARMNCHAYNSSSTVPNPVCAHCGVKSIPYSSSVIDEYWNDCANAQIAFILANISESTHQVVLPQHPEAGIHPIGDTEE